MPPLVDSTRFFDSERYGIGNFGLVQAKIVRVCPQLKQRAEIKLIDHRY
jgi:hypothetical protein